jgi:hypothetical protein
MSEIRERPLAGAACWRGAQLRADEWVYPLRAAEVDDLERALATARATGKPLLQITRDDFPLPLLEPAMRGWLATLQGGRGFLNVRGVPVQRHSDEDAAFFQWGLGLHLGTAVSQNAAGDLLGHVYDTGADPDETSVRLYKTRVELGFHSDGSDLVALMCIRQGRSGGENKLVSSAALYNEILRRRPDLVPLLYQPFHWDRNDEQAAGEPPTFALPICTYRNGHLGFFYIPWYIRKAQRHAHVPRLTRAQSELLDLIDAIAAEPGVHVAMRLEPGEINYLKNNAVLHARTAFVDFAEPERKRHLLRLWLTAHGDWADGDTFVRQGIPRKPGVLGDAEAIACTRQTQE